MTTGALAREDEGPVRWREVFRGSRGRLTAGLLLIEALAAVQVLVIATILPDIRRDLGMVQLYGLVFTSSSLATIATIPIAGRAVDRYGAGRTLPLVFVVFGVGLAVAGTAPTMPVLLVGQFLIGAGGGGLYAMSVGMVAKTFPDRMRARVLALLASMWIVPGLVGPPLGALIASTIGWRWAFAVPYPVLLFAWFLIAPSLHLVPASTGQQDRLPVRWPLQLMVGAGLVFTSFTIVEWWALAMFAAGLVIGLPALAHIVPRGIWRVAPGLPATAMSAFLLSMGFLAVDAFVTLMLTDVRGLSLGAAGAAVTLATLTWAAGSAWQSGRVDRMSLSRLLRIGVVYTLAGEVLVSLALLETLPVAVAYLGWTVVGFGMGIAFPTIPLAAMREAGAGEEASEVSSVLLMDMLGVATGAGIGGGIIAVTGAFGASLSAGIAGSFAVGIATLIGLLAVAGRLRGPGAPVHASATTSPGSSPSR